MQRSALEDALRHLYLLEALGREGAITDLGRRMAQLPLEPVLARTLLAAAELDCLSPALTVVAMLSADTIFQGNRSGLCTHFVHTQPHVLPTFWGLAQQLACCSLPKHGSCIRVPVQLCSHAAHVPHCLSREALCSIVVGG